MDVVSSHMADSEKILRAKLIGTDAMKRVPKYCNGTFMGKTSDGRIILTLVFKQPVQQEEGGEIDEENVVIDCILLDADHAKAIAEKLNDLTKK